MPDSDFQRSFTKIEGSPMMAVVRIVVTLVPLALGWVTSARPLSAQSTDNPLVRRGEVRITIAPEFRLSNQRLSVDGLEPLDADWDMAILGTDFAPILSPLEDALRSATGDPTFGLQLGTGVARISAMETRIPLGIAVGVHDRLTVGITVPLVRARFEAAAEVEGYRGGNVGWSPNQTDPNGVQAALSALSTAATAAQGAADGICTSMGVASAECITALSAATSADGLSSDMAGLYGGFLFFPTAGSVPISALHSRLESVRVALDELGVTGLPTSFPTGTALSDGDLETLARDPAIGARFHDFGNWRGGWGLGDIEAVAAVLLFRRLDDQGSPTTELSFGATARLATGDPDDPDRLFQMGSGSGYSEFGGFVHLSLGSRHLGIEADARVARGLEADIPVRVGPAGAVLIGSEQSTLARLIPGNHIRIAASPRIRLTPSLALALRYSFERTDASRFTRLSSAGPDPSLLDHAGSSTVQRIGGGLVFAAGSDAGGSRTPFEVRIRVDGVATGEGYGALAPLRASLEIRTFRRLFGAG